MTQYHESIRAANRERMIKAALKLWAEGGEKAVTARAVGGLCGCTGQRVQQVFKTMDGLRWAAAERAVQGGWGAVIEHMKVSGHPMVTDRPSSPLGAA